MRSVTHAIEKYPKWNLHRLFRVFEANTKKICDKPWFQCIVFNFRSNVANIFHNRIQWMNKLECRRFSSVTVYELERLFQTLVQFIEYWNSSRISHRKQWNVLSASKWKQIYHYFDEEQCKYIMNILLEHDMCVYAISEICICSWHEIK